MGIKHFFQWFKKEFDGRIYKMRKGQDLAFVNVSIDNLMIDMNGVFHASAQKIYEYGNCKSNPRLLKGQKIVIRNNVQTQIKVFQDICKTIDNLFIITKPKKRLILCVDGPAPLSKQNQQRQRRFRSALESSGSCPFNVLFTRSGSTWDIISLILPLVTSCSVIESSSPTPTQLNGLTIE